MRRAGWLAAALAALSVSPAVGYYHYSRYLSRSPWMAVQEKFDLNALPNRTLTFYVSDAGPTQYLPNDSFSSVISQIRQAAAAWNAVETSDLRVAFGGVATFNTPHSSPSAMVVFDDLGPGVLGLAGRTQGDLVFGPGGPFIPITQATIHLNRDMTKKPSYLEGFFATVVHEMGHAIGLQHTFTSSAMSTAVSRTTSRARVLDADDIAGVSLLYPSATFAGAFGSISGRVTMGGQGVNMASVVALRPTGSAISALTNPDGTFRIEGLPLDSTYWVYVHPLPPNPDIVPPLDLNGQQPIAPSGPFKTVFYTPGGAGTRDPGQSPMVVLMRGGPAAANINFAVEPLPSYVIYEPQIWSELAGNMVSPPYVNTNAGVGTLAMKGPGLTTAAGDPAPGLAIQILGGFGGASTARWSPPYLAVYLPLPPFAGTGPRHMLFSLPDDIFVLPSAVNLVQKAPPMVTGVVPNPDGTVAVMGTGMSPDSRVFFDGLPATVRVPFTGTEQSGFVVVQPPQGSYQQVAAVTVFNPDGLNSMMVQSQNPPTYSYGFAEPVFAAFAPTALPAGATAMVEVNGVNTRFAEGQTIVGFGSSDIVVRRVWVLSPTRLVANVSVAPTAPPFISTQVSVLTGFQLFTQAFGFQVLPANPQQPNITLPVANASPGQLGTYPGAAMVVNGANLALAPGSASVTLNDQPAQVLASSPSQVTFVVPAGMQPGPAVLRINNGAESAPPVVVQIDAVPPVIASVSSQSDAPVDAVNPARAGETLNLFLLGLDPAVVEAPHRIRVHEDEAVLTPVAVLPVHGQAHMYQLQVTLSPSVTGAQVQVMVSVEGASPSNPVYIPVAGA